MLTSEEQGLAPPSLPACLALAGSLPWEPQVAFRAPWPAGGGMRLRNKVDGQDLCVPFPAPPLSGTQVSDMRCVAGRPHENVLSGGDQGCYQTL